MCHVECVREEYEMIRGDVIGDIRGCIIGYNRVVNESGTRRA